MIFTLKTAGIFLCIWGVALAIINGIRADPLFTIMEKKEMLDEEAEERIKTMIDSMKED